MSNWRRRRRQFDLPLVYQTGPHGGGGVRRGKYNPCLYCHSESGLTTLVHGDDFVSVGSMHPAAKFRSQLESRFEIKTQVIGAPNPVAGARAATGSGASVDQCVQEGRVLNRIIRVCSLGWQYEPDQRHAEIIIKTLGLGSSKPVKTPGEEENKKEIKWL